MHLLCENVPRGFFDNFWTNDCTKISYFKIDIKMWPPSHSCTKYVCLLPCMPLFFPCKLVATFNSAMQPCAAILTCKQPTDDFDFLFVQRRNWKLFNTPSQKKDIEITICRNDASKQKFERCILRNDTNLICENQINK